MTQEALIWINVHSSDSSEKPSLFGRLEDDAKIMALVGCDYGVACLFLPPNAHSVGCEAWLGDIV